MTTQNTDLTVRASDLEKFEQEFKPLLDKFMEKLNMDVRKAAIKQNNGVNYLPIEIVEAALDSIFQGNWKIDNLHYSIEINSVVVSLDLSVLHPVSKLWITRSGIGSVPVQMNKQTNQINPMALQKNLPAAKAFAFKNAAQSLGRRLGRNLNRGNDIPFISDSSNFDSIFNTGSND